jgi:hypothetical protein
MTTFSFTSDARPWLRRDTYSAARVSSIFHKGRDAAAQRRCNAGDAGVHAILGDVKHDDARFGLPRAPPPPPPPPFRSSSSSSSPNHVDAFDTSSSSRAARAPPPGVNTSDGSLDAPNAPALSGMA